MYKLEQQRYYLDTFNDLNESPLFREVKLDPYG